MLHKFLLLLFFLFIQHVCIAQPGDIRQLMEAGFQWEKQGLKDTTAVKEFYNTMGFCTAWTGADNRTNQELLFTLLQNAGYYGLDEKDYQYELITQMRDSMKYLPGDTADINKEVKLTDAAIHFFSDIAFGNKAPSFYYTGLSYKPGCISIAWQLAKHIQYRLLPALLSVLQPPMAEIKLIQHAIIRWKNAVSGNMNMEVNVASTSVKSTNLPLLQRLYCLGIIDSASQKISDKELVAKVKEAQRMFELLDDGIIRNTLLRELNVPAEMRLQQLNLAINYYRWLYCLSRQQPVVVVNIPAAFLKVYEEGRPILQMRVIVGKPSTPTPTLSSRISEVVLYPYWTVPYSIATKELLPSIKRNPGYIDDNNYQVLNKQGRIMDPRSIDWKSLSAKNFPYIIRQSTGCDNALGLLKLNFYNPFSVYLHDTPSKSLFILNKRFFSHGCMRMEHPMDLGYLVLKNNTIAIDTLEQKGCLHNQSPITVPVTVQLPMVVWYNPVGLDKAERLVYYEDIYKRFSWAKDR
jgi:murein L,D-transpeptidase YcbB/YkuD